MSANHRPAELHIAGLVVYASPGRAARIGSAIAAWAGAEVHAQGDNGKLVVTLEAESGDAMSHMVERIRCLDGVLSAALVYQCADSLDAMNEEVS